MDFVNVKVMWMQMQSQSLTHFVFLTLNQMMKLHLIWNLLEICMNCIAKLIPEKQLLVGMFKICLIFQSACIDFKLNFSF